MEKILMEKELWRVMDKTRAGKTESRESLKGLIVYPGHLAACDGRMAVTITDEAYGHEGGDLEPGAYDVIAVNKYSKLFVELVLEKSDHEAPDVVKVIPNACGVDSDCWFMDILPEKENYSNISAAVVRLFKKTGNAYNHKYIERLAPLAASWKVDPAGKDKPARLAARGGGGVVAVILPFTIED